MRILVACEFSGIVRDAFVTKGHDAWSCDLEDTERDGNHIKDDILNHLNDNWDLMIAHPPCTYLSLVANRHNILFDDIPNYIRLEKRDEAKEFFMKLYNANIPKICIENPVGYINRFLSPSQIIHPYYFGEPIQKRTALWLRNLPKLNPTNMLSKPKPLYILSTSEKKKINWVEGGVRKSKDRSRTFQGIANAMAEQWV